MENTYDIRVERVYDDPGGATAGFRVFVDRLWPRGESKAKFHYDLWAKDVTPSTALREWYHADRDNRWDEFEDRYLAEQTPNPDLQQRGATLSAHPDIVLRTAARDVAHSHVPILKQYLSLQLHKH